MARASASNGNKIKKPTNACPNPGNGAHISSNSAAGSYLTKAQMHSALAVIDTSASSMLMKVARHRTLTIGIDAEDLLQEAILRGLTSRSCPVGLKVEHFLMAVMRSIASDLLAKRQRLEMLRRKEVDLLVAPPAPDAASEFSERACACRQALDDVIGGSPEIERVVDGIDHGFCGKSLARFVGTDQARLASVRRTIKRRVSRIYEGIIGEEL